MSRKANQGLTLVEILVTLMIAAVILGVTFSAWTSGLKMGKAAGVAAGVSSLGLLEAMLFEDLAQLGVDRVRDALLCQGDKIGFYKGSFTPGSRGPILLTPIVYDFIVSPAGNRLVRRRQGKEPPRVVPSVVLSNPRFDVLRVVAGSVLRLQATVLDADERPSPIAANTVRSVPLVLMLPITVPEGPGNWGLRPTVTLAVIDLLEL